ncbi:hypothetical protein TYRP_021119 [Tyrophagus putrescentiae]|nr:hypothetical protein TYRP_021119 [Tyrophagus putrescentiae]
MSIRVMNSRLGSSVVYAHISRRFLWTFSDFVFRRQLLTANTSACLQHFNARTLITSSASSSSSSSLHFSANNNTSFFPAFARQHRLLLGKCSVKTGSAVSLFWTQQRGAKKKAGGKGKGKKGEKEKAAASKEKEEEKDDEDEDDEEDSDSDQDEDSGENVSDDVKVMHTTVISLRLDAIGKPCFNIPRAKIEESFYSDLIRVNGERVAKKSYEVRVDDVIDYIKGLNGEDRSKLDITRVQILSVDDKAASSGRIRMSFRKTNGLTVDNYARDPYEGAL